MTKFEKEVNKIGWLMPYPNRFFFLKNKDEDDLCTIAFNTDSYSDLSIEELNSDYIDEKYVKFFIYCISCHTKFKIESKKWVIPLLMSDYYAYRLNYKRELFWAKKAIKNNQELTAGHFSKKIKKLL